MTISDFCDSEDSDDEDTILEIAEIEAIQAEAVQEAEAVIEADGEEVEIYWFT